MTDSVDDYVRIGIVLGTHGLDGRLKIKVITDIPERFTKDNKVYLEEKGAFKEYTIIDYRQQRGNALLRLSGIGDKDKALSLKNSSILIKKSEAVKIRDHLDPEEYFYYDIIGCTALVNRVNIGTVTDIISSGSCDILVIADKTGREYMVPFIEKFVSTGRLSERLIEVFPIEGLFDI